VCIYESVRVIKMLSCTGWRSLVGCLKVQVISTKEPLIIGLFCVCMYEFGPCHRDALVYRVAKTHRMP